MVFSSNVFLFAFLPCALAAYHLAPARLKNAVLVLFSLFFYLWGSGPQILLLLGSIAFNYALGLWIERERVTRPRGASLAVALGICANLALLLHFKYSFFFLSEAKGLLAHWGISLGGIERVALPVGISFYTFQAISYLVEVGRGQEKAQRSLVRFALFLSCFPHLVAGPVVRYSDISRELGRRTVTDQILFEGFYRFSIGLGKKVLVANTMGALADQVFKLPATELTTGIAWLGILAYAFQIYFDFSGYSDMAIGLARFFGFHFPENFDQPYRARTITEFWRRWHMSLSRWFRDFLYIPMGGNRHGPARTCLNLFTVFALCGLWHGASWNFLIWGLFHGSLLVIERVLRSRWGIEWKGVAGQALTFALVLVGWVFFRAETLEGALGFLRVMFAGNPRLAEHLYFPLGYYLQADAVTAFAVAAALSFIPAERAGAWLARALPAERARVAFTGCGALAALVLAIVFLSTSAFNPFIYYRF